MQIFLKKNAFFGGKEVFFVFFGVAVMGLEGDRDYRDYRGYRGYRDYRGYSLAFLFLGRRGRRHSQRCTASLLLFSSFCCRPVAVLLPSFCRLFAVFVSRLKVAGIGQGDYKKNHRNCYVKIKKTNFICVFQINVVSLRAFTQKIVNSMYCETK